MLAWQHAGLSGICARTPFESAFHPMKRALDAREQGEARRLFSFLEEALDRSGGPFLFASLTLADLVLAPAVVRLCRHDVALEGLPGVLSWTQRLIANPALLGRFADADAETPIWFDEYPRLPVTRLAVSRPSSRREAAAASVRGIQAGDQVSVGVPLTAARMAARARPSRTRSPRLR